MLEMLAGLVAATIIMGHASLLQRALARQNGSGPPDLSEGLKAIDESTIQLVRLVDELLDGDAAAHGPARRARPGARRT